MLSIGFQQTGFSPRGYGRRFISLVNLQQQRGMIPSGGRQEPKTTTAQGQGDMEWEEALLMAWGGEIPLHPADYYRRQAARARQIAEGVTTRAMKARLLEEAVQYDELAAKADLIAVGAVDL
jgi:hypothetical protein